MHPKYKMSNSVKRRSKAELIKSRKKALRKDVDLD